MVRNAALFLVALALVLPSVRARAAEARFGYVDLQRALNEVADGKAAKAKLKKEYDMRQKELDDKQEELKKLQSDLQARGDAMSEDAKRKAQGDLDQKLVEVSRLYATLQKELSQKERDATKGILTRMSTIIHTIAESEGVTMVFEKTDSALLYAQPSLDLTNELIRRYNMPPPAEKGGAPAKKD